MSYLVSDKQYWFGNEDMTQNFPDKSGLRSTSPYKTMHLDDKTVHESMVVEENNDQSLRNAREESKDLGRDYFDILQQEYRRRNPIKCFDPKVLFEFWKSLKSLQQRKEDEEMRSTYKSMGSTAKNGKISLKTQQRLLGGDGTFKKQKDNSNNPNQVILQAILNSSPNDVYYTLKLHSSDAQTEMNISNFLDDRTLQLKMKDKLKQKPKKSLSTACQNRLYPKKEVKKSSLFDRLEQIYLKENPSEEIDINDKTLFNYWLEMSPGAKSKHKLVYSNQNEVAILLEQAYSDKTLEFCEKLEELYKKQHPDHKDFKRANIMFEFWKNLASNEISTESKTFQNAREVIRVLEKFYNDKIKSLCKLFQDRFGFEVDNCKDKNGKIIMTKQARLFKFWKNELIVEGNEGFNQSPRHSTYKKEGRKSDNSPNKSQQSFMSNYSKKAQDYKKLRKIDFECDENVIFLIDDYFRDQEYRRNIKTLEREKEEQKQELEQNDKKRKNAKTSEEKEKFYENLALPKDRLKLGKALLHLRKMFPKDKILLKMILHEFKENKVSKYPLEYDVYDSEEEDFRKGRSTKDKEQEYVRLKEKEHEIVEHFMNDIEAYYNKKNQSLLKDKKTEVNQRQAENKVKRFVETIAKNFITLRKRRFEEKIPTLNEYLSEKFIDLKFLHKEIVKKMFPHLTYGESKRLKKRSFPISFKRYFFQVIKSFVKNKNDFEKNNKKKLPFWAPPSSLGTCRLHNDKDCPIDCKFQSLNKVVTSLCKTTRDSKALIDSKSENLWELPTYFEDRLNVMATFNDAKNCTFTPTILSSLLERRKASEVSKPKSFKDWVNAMGENFTRRFPALYKYGIFKRCVNWWRRGEILKAYKKLAEVFDIEKIKRHFNHKELQKDSIFTYENLGIDKSKLDLREDLENKKNINFLYDVYKLITYLEEYETEILKTKKEINMMLKSDNTHSDHFMTAKPSFYSDLKSEKQDNPSYCSRREQIKSHMCPLRDQCPDDIRPRWPNKDNKTNLPFGAKCPFAHHVFELKFKRELKTRKEMLKNNLKMLDKHLSNADVVPAVWVPGGRNFVDCIGCGEQLGTKGLCATCEMRKAINKKLELYLTKAKIKRREITSQKSFKTKQAIRKNEEESLNKKLGFLQRANILYSKERYSEAFAVIVKAVDIVKNELANNENIQKNKEDEWKAKLDFNYDAELTPEILYKEQYLSKTQNLNSNEQSEYEKNFVQKLTLFASKTGVVGEKQLNVNEFINHQIELTYLKIEKKFFDKQKDINLLKNKIDLLEGGGQSTYIEEKHENTEVSENTNYRKKMKVRKTMMCEVLLETGTCEKLKDPHEPCLYAHNPIELDLINDEIKINNLQKTINFCNKNMTDTNTPLAWRPTSKKDSIKKIKEFDEEEEIRRKAKRKEKKNHSQIESSREKMSKVKSIYEKEIEDLAKYPYERHKHGTSQF